MKFGYRSYSPKKSISAMTKGRVTRTIKRANPMYGKAGMGYVNNPKRAVYNKVYHKTTTPEITTTNVIVIIMFILFLLEIF